MEKIKSLLTGHKTEEHVDSASDQTTGTSGLHSGSGHQGLTGEGSHLAQAENRDTLGSSNTTGLGNDATSSGTGNTQTTGLSAGTNTAGPHSSNLANKADPRVDSDREGSRTAENTGYGNTTSGAFPDDAPANSSAVYGKYDGGNTGGNTSTGNEFGSSATNPSSTGAGLGSNIAGNTSTGSNYDSSNPTSSGHHLGRDAAAVGGVGAIGEHEHNKHSGAAGSGYDSGNTVGNNSTATDFGSSSTNPTSSGAGYGSSTGTTGQHQSSHLGRDAAVGAGGVGLAEHEHHKHQNERSTGTGGITGSNKQSDNTGFSGPHNTEVANRLDPSVNTSGGSGFETAHHHDKVHGGGAEEADHDHGSGSHLGRDAAVGAGGAGLAEHEHHRHERERGTGVGSTGGSTGLGQSSGAYDNTTGSSQIGTGQHQSSHLGRDAAVVGGGAGLAEHEHHKHQNERGTGAGSTSTGAYDNTTTGSSTGQSHLGRDAGVGAAGAGAASSLDGPAPNTAGPHKQDWLNKLDPRVNENPNQPQSTGHGPLKVTEGQTGSYEAGKHQQDTGLPDRSKDHHYGRDAGIAGGVGGAAYEADKHHQLAGTHQQGTGSESERSKDHHYGRDAGIAGGVGAGAYEADKHHQQKHDKDLTASEREAKKEHKHELKEEKKEAKREHKESKGGILSFLHRDKSKKYTPEEEAEFDRQEREQHSHKGRDAFGGAAVGGGAYEAEKYHRDHQHGSGIEGDTNKPLPTAPGNHGIGTGAGTQNALAGDNTTSTSSGHQLGRDAALVGGAGAVGEHEHHKHSDHNATPLNEKPRGKDLGDYLHGVERNRGVSGSTGFPHEQSQGASSSATGTSSTGTGQHHLGRDAAVGAGGVGLAEREHRKHEGQTGNNQYDNSSSGLTGSNQGQQSHLGRDAAGVGAAGLVGEHEHRKHEGYTGSKQYANSSSGLTGSNQGQQSHLGRDTAGIGAAGLVGEHEHRKHEATSGEQYGTTGQQSSLGGASGQQYGTTGSGLDFAGTGATNTSHTHGERNRLHKDPPANHPAAQALQGGVPAGGAERRDLVGQGEQRLDSDTGVANAHGQGNSTSNY